MKTLTLEIAGTPRMMVGVVPVLAHALTAALVRGDSRTLAAALIVTAQEFSAAGFASGEPVTLVPTAALTPLLAREAYRVHCSEKLAKRMCGCMVTYLGDPAPSGDCPKGQRLAAAITSAKEGTL